MHEDREAAIWDAGYLIGYRHGAAQRPNLLAGKYPEPCKVIDLRAWRIEHAAVAGVR